MTVQQGQVFADRYLVEATLGAGAMGVVYRVLDQRLHRLAALKVMDPALSQDPAFRARFEREAKAGARFEHHNVVQVHHYDEYDDTLYLVMQYVDGPNLRDVLAQSGRLDAHRTAEIVRQVGAGLDAAHRNGHVHCDVKPANVLIGRHDDGTDRVLITDFGLAQPLGAVGEVLGTMAYASPEQLRGEPVGIGSDVYALACLTYTCLAGRPPFIGAESEVAQGHLEHQPMELTALVPGLSPALSRAVSRGLSKDPADRPTSAGAFASSLAVIAPRRVVTPPPTPTADLTQAIAPPPPLAPAGVPRKRRSKVLPIAAGVIAVAFAVGLYVGLDNGPSGGGATADPSSSGTAGTSQQALIARLPPSVFSGCTGTDLSGKRTASVTCSSTLSGADQLLVSQWPDAATMATDFATSYGSKPDGKCGQYTGTPASGLRSTWGGQQALACYLNTNGAAVVMWEYRDPAVQVLAIRKDGNAKALFAYWQAAVQKPLVS